MNQQRLSGNKSRETVKEIEEIRMNYMTQPQHTSINTQQFISKAKWRKVLNQHPAFHINSVLLACQPTSQQCFNISSSLPGCAGHLRDATPDHRGTDVVVTRSCGIDGQFHRMKRLMLFAMLGSWKKNGICSFALLTTYR